MNDRSSPDDFTFLKDTAIETELRKVLLEKMFEERQQAREMQSRAAESASTQSLERKRFWHNTPLMVALVGTITIAANAISSVILSDQNSRNEATKEERTFAYGVIERELAKSTDTTKRAGVLLFLTRAGVLNSLNRDELEKMALNDLAEANVDPNKVGIPDTVGTGLPDYNLQVPRAHPEQTFAASRLVEHAVHELNRNVEEYASFDELTRYWSAVPGFPAAMVSPETPWSAAFVSWLITAAGNPDGLELSAVNLDIWHSATAKGLSFAPAEKESLPGDLVFIARSDGEAKAAREGKRLAASGTGVVYSVEGSVLHYIGGNIANAVRLRRIEASDPRIIGFVRISGSATGGMATTR